MPNSHTESARILVVSREASALAPLWAMGQANFWQLETANSGWEALERVQSEQFPDLVLLDLGRNDSDGLHTLRWLRRMRPDLPIVVLSHAADAARKPEAIRLGAREYLVQPLDSEELEAALRRHLSLRHERSKMDVATEEVEALGDHTFFVAASHAMRKVRAQAELLAQLNVPVLLAGEKGSGRETVARFIHKLSVRSAFRFVKVNCAALPGDLLESELFGYERSVFNGVARSKAGKFEVCDRGAIFLEEFTEIPLPLQGKLLHFLQERHSTRAGGEVPAKPDVRVFAASNLDIEQALAEEKLREDLYYRLSSFTVQVPPLRERREEIPLLLGYFMNRLARHYGLAARIFSPAVLSACQFYSWPGNLSELENFVKRYLVAGDESQAIRELDPKQARLPEPAARSEARVEPRHGNSGQADDSSLRSLVQSVKGETERNAISTALETTRWNRKAAARLLRVSYRTLLYKIQQYRMAPPPGYVAPANGNGAKSNGR